LIKSFLHVINEDREQFSITVNGFKFYCLFKGFYL
jgi:hypothetical protein